MIVKNKNGIEFEIEDIKFLHLMAIEVLSISDFEQYEGTIDEYLEELAKEIGEPRFPAINAEAMLCGASIFEGIKLYGASYIDRLLEKSDEPSKYVQYLVIHLLDTMAEMQKQEKELN